MTETAWNALEGVAWMVTAYVVCTTALEITTRRIAAQRRREETIIKAYNMVRNLQEENEGLTNLVHRMIKERDDVLRNR